MKYMAEESNGEYNEFLFELETLIEGWGDACVQNENMARLLKKQNGRTDCMARGNTLTLKSCIADIKELIKKYSQMKDDKFTIHISFSKVRSKFHKPTKVHHPKKGLGKKYKRERYKYNDYQEE